MPSKLKGTEITEITEPAPVVAGRPTRSSEDFLTLTLTPNPNPNPVGKASSSEDVQGLYEELGIHMDLLKDHNLKSNPNPNPNPKPKP